MKAKNCPFAEGILLIHVFGHWSWNTGAFFVVIRAVAE